MRFLLIIAIFLLSGCNSDPVTQEVPPTDASAPESLTDTIAAQISKAQQQVQELASGSKDTATEEVEKLFTFDYRVVEFDKSLPATDLELKLNELGKERWECFHVEPRESVLQFFCSRRPKTYLRYIPRVF